MQDQHVHSPVRGTFIVVGTKLFPDARIHAVRPDDEREAMSFPPSRHVCLAAIVLNMNPGRLAENARCGPEDGSPKSTARLTNLVRPSRCNPIGQCPKWAWSPRALS